MRLQQTRAGWIVTDWLIWSQEAHSRKDASKILRMGGLTLKLCCKTSYSETTSPWRPVAFVSSFLEFWQGSLGTALYGQKAFSWGAHAWRLSPKAAQDPIRWLFQSTRDKWMGPNTYEESATLWGQCLSRWGKRSANFLESFKCSGRSWGMQGTCRSALRSSAELVSSCLPR